MPDRRKPHVSETQIQHAKEIPLAYDSQRTETQMAEALATLLQALEISEAKTNALTRTHRDSDHPRGYETREHATKIFRIADYLRERQSKKTARHFHKN